MCGIPISNEKIGVFDFYFVITSIAYTEFYVILINYKSIDHCLFAPVNMGF